MIDEAFWKRFTRDGHMVFGHPYNMTRRVNIDYVVCECGEEVYLPTWLFDKTSYKFGGLI